MQFHVGQIIKSKRAFDNICLDDDVEHVQEEQYFIIVSYGFLEEVNATGYCILSQKTLKTSFWETVLEMKHCFGSV